MKKICFVVPSLSSGGAERVVSILASTLAEEGKPIFLVVHRRATNEYPISEKVDCIYLDEGTQFKSPNFAKIERVKRVRKYLKANNVDYVVPFLDSCLIHTFIASRGLRCKFISTLRNNPYERTKKEARLCDFIARFSDANFVQNEMQKLYFSEKIRKKTFIVSNPVNPIFCNNIKGNITSISRLIAIGRLNVQKNYYRLIDAFSILLSAYDNLQLSIYGEGDMHDLIKEYIDQKGISDNVFLMGRTSDVIAALSSHDLFVMSSDFEGMPNALMEAMMYGMPCVSTNCPTGPKDLLGNNERGRLASMESPDELAKEIAYYIDNVELANEHRLLARQYMKSQYSAKEISRKFYEECIKW